MAGESTELRIIARLEDLATAQLSALGKRIREFGTSTQASYNEAARAGQSLRNSQERLTSSTSRVIGESAKRRQEVTTTVGTLTRQQRAETSLAASQRAGVSAIRQQADAVRQAGAQYQAASRGIGILRRAIAPLTAALTSGLIFRQAVRDAREFNDAMSEVATLVDTATVSVDGLAQGVQELAAAQGINQTIVARGLYQTISAGITESADALRFLEQANKLAVAGVATTAQSVDLLTTALNAYGISADGASDASDVLFRTVQLGKTTIPELASSLGQVIPIAAALGVSLEEVSAAVATLTKGGIDTGTATTQLRGVFASLIKPGSDAQQVLSQYGIDVSRARIESDGFAAVLTELQSKLGDNQTLLARVVPDVRALTAAFALVGTQAETFRDILASTNNATGATAEAFQQRFQSSAQVVSRAVNALRVNVSKFGQAFDESLANSLRASEDLSESFEVIGNAARVLGLVVGESFANIVDLTGRLAVSADGLAERWLEADENARTFTNGLGVTERGVFSLLSPLGLLRLALDLSGPRESATRLADEIDKVVASIRSGNSDLAQGLDPRLVTILLQDLTLSADELRKGLFDVSEEGNRLDDVLRQLGTSFLNVDRASRGLGRIGTDASGVSATIRDQLLGTLVLTEDGLRRISSVARDETGNVRAAFADVGASLASLLDAGAVDEFNRQFVALANEAERTNAVLASFPVTKELARALREDPVEGLDDLLDSVLAKYEDRIVVIEGIAKRIRRGFDAVDFEGRPIRIATRLEDVPEEEIRRSLTLAQVEALRLLGDDGLLISYTPELQGEKVREQVEQAKRDIRAAFESGNFDVNASGISEALEIIRSFGEATDGVSEAVSGLNRKLLSGSDAARAALDEEVASLRAQATTYQALGQDVAAFYAAIDRYQSRRSAQIDSEERAEIRKEETIRRERLRTARESREAAERSLRNLFDSLNEDLVGELERERIQLRRTIDEALSEVSVSAFALRGPIFGPAFALQLRSEVEGLGEQLELRLNTRQAEDSLLDLQDRIDDVRGSSVGAFTGVINQLEALETQTDRNLKQLDRLSQEKFGVDLAGLVKLDLNGDEVQAKARDLFLQLAEEVQDAAKRRQTEIAVDFLLVPSIEFNQNVIQEALRGAAQDTASAFSELQGEFRDSTITLDQFISKSRELSEELRLNELAIRRTAISISESIRGAALDSFIEFGDGVQNVANATRASIDGFRQASSDALFDFITGAKSAKEAFEDFGLGIARSVARALTDLIALQLTAALLQEVLNVDLNVSGSKGLEQGAKTLGLSAVLLRFAATPLERAADKLLAAAAALTAANLIGGGTGIPFLAKGGIIKGGVSGTLPVRKYASGGVASSAQLAIFGEAGAEAFVPLPDGKTIPVTLRGDIGGGSLDRSAGLLAGAASSLGRVAATFVAAAVALTASAGDVSAAAQSFGAASPGNSSGARSSSSAAPGSFYGGVASVSGSVMALADGGVVSGHIRKIVSGSPLPVRTYARGGVANEPQVAVFGEGGAEAFVPLPGPNRGIPVEFRGQPERAVNVAVTYQIQALDAASVRTLLEREGKALGDIIASVARNGDSRALNRTLQRGP